MLWKAERELARLQSDLSIDNVFNFFVTAYHLMDYVEVQKAAPQATIDAMYHDPDFQECRFICNKGKHLELRRQPDKATAVIRTHGGAYNTSAYNTRPFNAGPLIRFLVDGKEVDIRTLAARILQKWQAFFTDNHIA
jgi:hypothetical protein